MSRLRYAGKYTPTSDYFIAHKGFTDGYWDLVRTDNVYIDGQMAPVLANLTDTAYVDGQDALKAKKTYVDAQDALYVPSSQRGAANGVAPTDSSALLPSANVPAGLLTDRVSVPATTLTMSLTGTHTCTSPSNTKEYLAATLAISDPGFPYLPIVFGAVMGSASGDNPGDGKGTGTYGQAIVFDTANNVWARAVTSANYRLDTFPLVPWASGGATPVTMTGANTLSLYMSLYSQSDVVDGYTFTNVGFSFWALLMSAI